MNKADLVKYLIKKTNLQKTVASRVVEVVLDGITEGLVADKNVNLSGFGNFSLKKRSQREGINPRTGERLLIKANLIPQFTPSKKFIGKIIEL